MVMQHAHVTFRCDLCKQTRTLEWKSCDEVAIASGLTVCTVCRPLLPMYLDAQIQQAEDLTNRYHLHQKLQDLPKLIHPGETFPWQQARQETLRWLRTLPSRTDWIVLDLESTGFHKTAEVIELVIVDHTGTILLNTLIKPQGVSHPMALAAHGIRSYDTKDAPLFRDIWETLLPFIDGKEMISYSVAFDLRILMQSAAIYGLSFPVVSTRCLMNAYARYCRPYLHPEQYKPYPLWAACEHLGIEDKRFHRAETDTLVAFQLLQALIQQAQEE